MAVAVQNMKDQFSKDLEKFKEDIVAILEEKCNSQNKKINTLQIPFCTNWTSTAVSSKWDRRARQGEWVISKEAPRRSAGKKWERHWTIKGRLSPNASKVNAK